MLRGSGHVSGLRFLNVTDTALFSPGFIVSGVLVAPHSTRKAASDRGLRGIAAGAKGEVSVLPQDTARIDRAVRKVLESVFRTTRV